MAKKNKDQFPIIEANQVIDPVIDDLTKSSDPVMDLTECAEALSTEEKEVLNEALPQIIQTHEVKKVSKHHKQTSELKCHPKFSKFKKQGDNI